MSGLWWVMSHVWMRHVTHVNEACHTCKWGMSHKRMGHVSYEGDVSRHVTSRAHACAMSANRAMSGLWWLMSHVWMRHVTHVNEAYHTYEWDVSCVTEACHFMCSCLSAKSEPRHVRSHCIPVHVCLYVCVCVCARVCVHVCAYIYTCINEHVNMHVHVHTHTHAHTHTHTHTHTHK